MNHYSLVEKEGCDSFEKFLAQVSADKHEWVRGTLNLYGVYLRADGSLFSSDTHPRNLSAKKKRDVVAVCHPANGFAG